MREREVCLQPFMPNPSPRVMNESSSAQQSKVSPVALLQVAAGALIIGSFSLHLSLREFGLQIPHFDVLFTIVMFLLLGLWMGLSRVGPALATQARD